MRRSTSGSPSTAIVAWGGPEALVAAVDAHLEAGATHVCIQPLDPDDATRPSLKTLEALAPRLGVGAE